MIPREICGLHGLYPDIVKLIGEFAERTGAEYTIKEFNKNDFIRNGTLWIDSKTVKIYANIEKLSIPGDVENLYCFAPLKELYCPNIKYINYKNANLHSFSFDNIRYLHLEGNINIRELVFPKAENLILRSEVTITKLFLPEVQTVRLDIRGLILDDLILEKARIVRLFMTNLELVNMILPEVTHLEVGATHRSHMNEIYVPSLQNGRYLYSFEWITSAEKLICSGIDTASIDISRIKYVDMRNARHIYIHGIDSLFFRLEQLIYDPNKTSFKDIRSYRGSYNLLKEVKKYLKKRMISVHTIS